MRLIIIATVLVLSTKLTAQQKYACSSDEIAFYGNDLITYYDGKPVKGNPEYLLDYEGLKLQFVNKVNLEKFKKDPQKYLPAYGGWCAIALTSGALVQPDFNHFKVENGELMFFEVKAFFNGKTAWEKDPEINKIVADKKFNDIFKE
ncbi:MAG: YHS domain-containing protein [Cyclobacteriaceae bacterium]|jgi:YHS domain-containing protein